jgi:hypothetical protein
MVSEIVMFLDEGGIGFRWLSKAFRQFKASPANEPLSEFFFGQIVQASVSFEQLSGPQMLILLNKGLVLFGFSSEYKAQSR